MTNNLSAYILYSFPNCFPYNINLSLNPKFDQLSGFINSIAIGNDQQDPSVFIGGTFKRVGGGSRLGTVSVTNIAKLGSGETMGPGEIEFEKSLTAVILSNRRKVSPPGILYGEKAKKGINLLEGYDSFNCSHKLIADIIL